MYLYACRFKNSGRKTLRLIGVRYVLESTVDCSMHMFRNVRIAPDLSTYLEKRKTYEGGVFSRYAQNKRRNACRSSRSQLFITKTGTCRLILAEIINIKLHTNSFCGSPVDARV